MEAASADSASEATRFSYNQGGIDPISSSAENTTQASFPINQSGQFGGSSIVIVDSGTQPSQENPRYNLGGSQFRGGSQIDLGATRNDPQSERCLITETPVRRNAVASANEYGAMLRSNEPIDTLLVQKMNDENWTGSLDQNGILLYLNQKLAELEGNSDTSSEDYSPLMRAAAQVLDWDTRNSFGFHEVYHENAASHSAETSISGRREILGRETPFLSHWYQGFEFRWPQMSMPDIDVSNLYADLKEKFMQAIEDNPGTTTAISVVLIMAAVATLAAGTTKLIINQTNSNDEF